MRTIKMTRYSTDFAVLFAAWVLVGSVVATEAADQPRHHHPAGVTWTWLADWQAWSQYPELPVACREQFGNQAARVRHFKQSCDKSAREGAEVSYLPPLTPDEAASILSKLHREATR